MANGNNELTYSPWRDFTEDDIPQVPDICAECNEGYAVPFDVKDPSEASTIDQHMGLDHSTVTLDWFLNRDYLAGIDAKYLRANAAELDHSDTFLERVFIELSKICSEEKLAEIYAYIGVEHYEFNCVDDYVKNPIYGQMSIPAVLRDLNPLARDHPDNTTTNIFQDNFTFLNSVFGGNSITFTSCSHAKATFGQAPIDTKWEIQGRYDAKKAASEFLRNYEGQKKKDEWWRNFWATVEVGMAVLSVVPIVGQFAMAARGTIAAVRVARYAFYSVESFMAADSFIRGTTQLIGGKSISLGTEMFKAIGQLADPENGAKRGEQAFLVINLALLTPLAYGSVKRIYSAIGRRSSEARFSEAVLDQLHRAEIPSTTPSVNIPVQHVPTQGKPLAIHLEMQTSSKLADGASHVSTMRMTPSLETKSTFVAIVNEGERARANIVFQAKTLREQLVTMIVQGASKGKIGNFLGRVGEAHLKKHLVETLKVDPKNILGAFENASGQGLDLIIRVPPPPSITRRIPQTNAERRSIAGTVRGHQNLQETLDFSKFRDGEMILVFEVKSTQTMKTPGFIASTQGAGGQTNVQRVIDAFNRGDPAYSVENLIGNTPNYQELLRVLTRAQRNGRIEYMHAQAFFKVDGSINNAVGSGSGIQLNNWK